MYKISVCFVLVFLQYAHIDKIAQSFASLERNVLLEGDGETVCCDISDDDIAHKRRDFFRKRRFSLLRRVLACCHGGVLGGGRGW